MSDKAWLSRRVDRIGWGLFFIWVGVAVLVDVGWGVGLLGVGLLTLIEQAARKYLHLKVDGFWVVVGFLLVIGSGWAMFETRLTIVAILLIAAGVGVFLGALRDRS